MKYFNGKINKLKKLENIECNFIKSGR